MSEQITEQVLPFLVLREKSLPPSRRDIPGPIFTIGRGTDNDLQIADTLISRKHAEIVLMYDGRYLLRDKGSKSGTFVGGHQVTEHFLEPGDEIVLGDASIATLKFEFPTNVTTSNLKPLDTSRIDLRLTARQTRFINLDLLRKGHVTSRTLERLTSLYEITHALLPIQNMEELLTAWLDALFTCLPIERGAILLNNPTTQRLEIITSRDEKNSKECAIKISSTIVDQTFNENVAIRSNDATTDERFSTQQSVIIQRICSVLSAPISSKQRVWGVCYLYSHTPGLFDSEDLEFLMATAREAGLVIENIRLTEELRAMQEQLIRAERLATIGKITSAISHELRNRLALLSGAKVLEMKFGDDPEVKQFADMVLTGQKRALALVEEIREFARNRPVEYEKISRPILPTLERTISLMRLDPLVTKRKLVLNAEDVPGVAFNDEKIEQVIINLVRNAAEATADHEGRITMTLTSDESDVIIRVADNGTGITPEFLARIWEPFFTTKDEGTGLGLEICRRIIEAHGGTISCESEVGKGTTFTIRLPIKPGGVDTEDLLSTLVPGKYQVDEVFDTAERTVERFLTPERLSRLSKDIIEDLGKALTEGDVEAANRVADRIALQDRGLAMDLKNMVKAYRFDELLDMLEKI